MLLGAFRLVVGAIGVGELGTEVGNAGANLDIGAGLLRDLVVRRNNADCGLLGLGTEGVGAGLKMRKIENSIRIFKI